MRRIQQLPASVVTKIAAGEVIERPASVVKELLENSVDAVSTRIEVDIEQGGSELIRVADDGCGISANDLPLAFASHATSKLSTADDLFRIQTLGFRGEALASIGGVAQVTLQSRQHEGATGAELTCHGGSLSEVRSWNGSAGTRIEVRHLFYNTPVRRKFLRTPATEIGHISEAFTRLALANPNLGLILRHNGKLVHEVPAATSVADRLTLFFGREVGDLLYPLEVAHGPIRFRGYLADPSCERGTARMQYIFVNGRFIRDRSLGHAVQEAYRGLLMTGRYAVVFLFLDLPPDQLDVNVHPTKIEVRFRDAQVVYHLVFGAIRDQLRRQNLTPRLQVPAGAVPVDDRSVPLPEPPSPMFAAPIASPVGAIPVVNGNPIDQVARPVPEFVPTEPGPPPFLPTTTVPRALQLYDSYLVLETAEGMLVVDQHALHERILFEQLKRRIAAGDLETQRLLIPEPVDLTAEQAARVLENREALADLGLSVEDFGGGTILLTSYPAILGNRSPRSILLAVVDHLAAKERMPSREHLLNQLLSLMACHAAVRAGDRLSAEEIAALLAQRDLVSNTHHCPHGRPTTLLFSRQELDRQFRRI